MMRSEVLTRDGRKTITAYTWDEAPLPILKFKGIQRNHKIIKYATTYATIDTETSNDGEARGWVYQWAVKFGGVYIYGRKPSEIKEMLIRIAERYKLTEEKRIIFYFHNASYDLQYLKHHLKQYDPTLRFFAVDSHTILICDILGFRILCSYKMTNLSLDALSKNYAKKYIKASGAIDYRKRRYQDSALDANDWFYMFSDVASQYDGVREYLRSNGYTHAADAPITSTGFVRNDCRNASRAVDTWRDDFLKMQLSPEQYNLCRAAFMGGLTIASYKYTGQTVRSENLAHVDFTSSYPARQMLDYFPMGKPEDYGDIDDMEELEDLLNSKCCVFIAHYDRLQIREGVTAPYVPSSKLISSAGVIKVNGKVVYADHAEIALTEIDYKIIREQYHAENIKVSHMLTFDRGPLPDWFKGKVMEYFYDKCTLKNKNELLYTKQKNRLNGLYGMSATAIVRELYEADENLIINKSDKSDTETQVKKFYNNYNSFLPYQWALYVTAHSRKALIKLIQTVGYENFLYCDTDSEFFILTEKNRPRIKAYKEELIQRAIRAGAYVGDKYLGAAEDEPPIRAFRPLHAKCYAMEEQNRKGDYDLKVVIAGVPKKTTKWIKGEPVTISNADELKHIDNLEDGFTFRHNGGTRTIYVEAEPEIINIDGHETEISSAAIICDIEKEINDTMFTVGADYTLLNIAQERG